MSMKPDTGYSVTCPEVQDEMKRPFSVMLSPHGTASGPFLFFRSYFDSNAFMFVYHIGNGCIEIASKHASYYYKTGRRDVLYSYR